jgi:hypothetical protein
VVIDSIPSYPSITRLDTGTAHARAIAEPALPGQ